MARILAAAEARRGLRRPARAAIAAIRARLPDDRGALGLLDADDAEGALSPPALEGDLSPADEDG